MGIDPKPRKRIKDPLLLMEYRGERWYHRCDACHDRRGQEIHHRKLRSQGGDDVRENLAWAVPLVPRISAREPVLAGWGAVGRRTGKSVFERPVR